MIRVIDTRHVICISFNTKKALSKARKDKLKELFSEFTFENNESVVIASSNECRIIFNSQNIMFEGGQYDIIYKCIPNVLNIFDIDPKSKQFSIELSVQLLCNNEMKNMTPFEQAQVISNFLELPKSDKKIITSVEYVRFIESMNNILITTSFKMYNQGIGIKAMIILESIEGFDKYFDNLESYLNVSVVKSLKEDKKED